MRLAVTYLKGKWTAEVKEEGRDAFLVLVPVPMMRSELLPDSVEGIVTGLVTVVANHIDAFGEWQATYCLEDGVSIEVLMLLEDEESEE